MSFDTETVQILWIRS